MKVVDKITYPNGKIYVGSDLTDTRLGYFGSADRKLLEQDTDREELRDFVIRKQILWESESASDQEVRRVEAECIVQHRANDPSVGYNRRPVFRASSSADA